MAKKAGKTIRRKAPPLKRSHSAPQTTVAASQTEVNSGPRRLKPKKTRFNLTKNIKHPVKLPNVWQLTKAAALLLWQYKKLFIGLTLIYGLLNLILVQGLSNSTDVTSLKNALTGHAGSILSGLSIFVVLVGSAGNGSSQTAGAYQLFLAIITSLAVIWTLRHVMSGSLVRIRDSYYKGMYPLVPFILVLLVIALQLVPLIIGASLYSTVITNSIATNFIEKLIWLVIFIGFAALSLYMLSSSVFALYIVTLPDMTPRKALRSARELVRYRRWTVIRKVLAMPVILLIVFAIIMLPIIIWLTGLASWVFFILTTFTLVAVHAYMYTLYRELLNE